MSDRHAGNVVPEITREEHATIAGVRGSNTVGEKIIETMPRLVEIILWVKRLTASGAIIVKQADLKWTEEW